MMDNWYRCIDVLFLRFHLVRVRKEVIPIWGATENGKEFKENKIVYFFYIQGVSISSHWWSIAKGNKGKPNGVGRKERNALPWDLIMWVKVHTVMSPLSFSSVQSLSRVWLFVTPLTAVSQASLSITNSQSSPNPCPLSRWSHPTISSSVFPFSSCPQSFPALGSFPMSQLFASGGQNIGISGSASVLPMNIQDWFPLGWTGWISLLSLNMLNEKIFETKLRVIATGIYVI